MKRVEYVSLRDSFRAQVANEQSRPIGKLFPTAFTYVLALILDEFVILSLRVRSPRLIVFGQIKSCSDLVLSATLQWCAALRSIHSSPKSGLLVLWDGGRRIAKSGVDARRSRFGRDMHRRDERLGGSVRAVRWVTIAGSVILIGRIRCMWMIVAEMGVRIVGVDQWLLLWRRPWGKTRWRRTKSGGGHWRRIDTGCTMLVGL